MIRIAIVDDEEPLRNQMCKYMETIINEDDEVEISTFGDGESFLEKMNEGKQYDILYLDIQMTGMNGMELGKKVREADSDIYIIFITSYAEYAAQSYLIEAYQYILKQDLSYRLPIITRRVLNMIKKEKTEYRMIATTGDMKKVYYKNIIYISKEKSAKYVQYITDEGELRERMTLEQIYDELKSKLFLMVERGYIVNLKRVSRLSGNTIFLDNGVQIEVGRRRLPEVRKKISEYWKES